MNEGRLQFRVGLFVIISMVLSVVIVFRLGEARWLFSKSYRISILFEDAPGVFPGTPVRKNGVTIGHVRQVEFDHKDGGILIHVDVSERHQLRDDTRAQLSLSILGDASIEFTPGRSQELLKPGSIVPGDSATDPMKMIAKLDARVTRTLDSFAQTSQEWGKVARNVNGLLETNSGNLETLVENAATSLQDFSKIMNTTNRIMSDPKNQKSIQMTLESLPSLVEETRKSITAVRGAVQRAEETLAHVSEVTEPLARHSASIAAKLDRGLGNLDVLLLELSKFSRNLSSENGSLQLLVSDPDLYNNLTRSAGMLESLMRNLEPILKDARVATDKIARNPELLGVGGALRGSDGLKDVEPNAAERGSAREKIQRTGGLFRSE